MINWYIFQHKSFTSSAKGHEPEVVFLGDSHVALLEQSQVHCFVVCSCSCSDTFQIEIIVVSDPSQPEIIFHAAYLAPVCDLILFNTNSNNIYLLSLGSGIYNKFGYIK